MAPPSYADLGKNARDLFGKGYNHGFLKFDSTTRSGEKGEVQFKSGAAHNLTSQKLAGSLEAQYKLPEHGLTLTEKWNTDNVLTTVIETKNQFAKGLTATIEGTYIPQNTKRTALLKTEWANDLLKINANLTLIDGPILTLSGVAARADWLFGVTGKVNLAANELSNTGLTVGRVVNDYAITASLIDSKHFGASLFHKVHRNLELGSQVNWTLGDAGTQFGIATKYLASNDLILRAKLDNKSNVSVAATHDLANGVKLTFSSQFSLLGGVETSNNKFGLGLEYTS
uniref:Voltage-dependent anion-selective channel protein 3 n=1 Tax=Panagrellus redivivus TaxID=6233 RepID=A0A7E4V919_PANRE